MLYMVRGKYKLGSYIATYTKYDAEAASTP